MKKVATLLLMVSVFVLVFGMTMADDDFREWTSTSGSKVTARLRSHAGTKVELLTKEGQIIRLELNQLSKADRDYLAVSGTSGGEILASEVEKGSWYEYSLPEKSKFICEYQLAGKSTFTITIPAKGKDTQIVGFDFKESDALYEGGKLYDKAVSVRLKNGGEYEALVSGRFARKYPVKSGKVEFVIENFTDVATKAIVWTE